MKLNVTSLIAFVLVCISFFFLLSCFDFFMTANINFGQNPNLQYTYWTLLTLIVIVFGFGLAFMSYMLGMGLGTCAGLFLTVILLYAGGLLDQFYALLSYIQGKAYTFYPWSLQAKLISQSWGWPEQTVWSLVFYGSIVAIWYFLLKKK